jgi:ribosomal protein L11 methyltransferase
VLDPHFEDRGYAIALAELDEARDIWELSVYVPHDDTALVRTELSGMLPDLAAGAILEEEDLPDIDWVSLSLEGLKPVRVGRYLVHGSHDRAKVKAGDLAIEIDAGQAFGTGHHGTTAGCLEMMDRIARFGRTTNILDLGTGSAVLAIAAAKRFHVPVLATDIDPVAVAVARRNIRKNGVETAIRTRTAAGFHAKVFAESGPFDLVVANILARPLMAIAPDLRRHLAPGGQVILSGIGAAKRWRVIAAYRDQGLFHRHTIWRDGWVTMHLSA